MQLIYDKSIENRQGYTLDKLDVPSYKLKTLTRQPADLPQMSELDVIRHYTELSTRAFGVETGFYPLGSCTMKYNPKVNELIAGYEGFNSIHPLQPSNTIKGIMEIYTTLNARLCEICGMDSFTMQPAAGAHGEFTGLLLIKAYHKSKGDIKRTNIIVPDSAHGTNPASANMCGFNVINVASNSEGGVDVEALKAVVDENTAGLMLTNPSTLGLFERNITQITDIIHKAGGLVYYDGANLNAIMGIVRVGDMGFDVIHLNLHKTFSTPHGGGGAGSGPVGCKKILTKFLPVPHIESEEDCSLSIGKVKNFYGNFSVIVKALAYIETLGGNGLKDASVMAVLNANYLRVKLSKLFDIAYDRICMHEFVLTLEKFKAEHGVSALDISKAMLDFKLHPPTMYFPLIVHEALMFEPTETESKQTMDDAIAKISLIKDMAINDSQALHNSPSKCVIRRVDEVRAARNPILKHIKK